MPWREEIAISRVKACFHTASALNGLTGQVDNLSAVGGWTQLVNAKIEAQAEVLDAHNLNSSDLRAMASRIKFGDTDNAEARAAQRYWPRLMGKSFRRGHHRGGDALRLADDLMEPFRPWVDYKVRKICESMNMDDDFELGREQKAVQLMFERGI